MSDIYSDSVYIYKLSRYVKIRFPPPLNFKNMVKELLWGFLQAFVN